MCESDLKTNKKLKTLKNIKKRSGPQVSPRASPRARYCQSLAVLVARHKTKREAGSIVSRNTSQTYTNRTRVYAQQGQLGRALSRDRSNSRATWLVLQDLGFGARSFF